MYLIAISEKKRHEFEREQRQGKEIVWREERKRKNDVIIITKLEENIFRKKKTRFFIKKSLRTCKKNVNSAPPTTTLSKTRKVLTPREIPVGQVLA